MSNNRSGSPSSFIINIFEYNDKSKTCIQIQIDQQTTFYDLAKKIKYELNKINQSNCSNQSNQIYQTNSSNQSISNTYDLIIYLQNEQYQGNMNDYLIKKLNEIQCQIVSYKKVPLLQTQLKRASNSTHHHGELPKQIPNYYHQKQDQQISQTTTDNQISKCCQNYSRQFEAQIKQLQEKISQMKNQHNKEIEKCQMQLQQIETEKRNLQQELNDLRAQIQNQKMKNTQTQQSNIKQSYSANYQLSKIQGQNTQIDNKSRSYSQLEQDLINQKSQYEKKIENMKKEKDELLQELNKMNLRNQLGNQEQQYAIQELNSKLQNKSNNLNNSVQQKQESVVAYQYSKIQNQQLDQSIIKIKLNCNHAYETIKLSEIITQAIMTSTYPKCQFCNIKFKQADLRRIDPIGEQFIVFQADKDLNYLFERMLSKNYLATCQTNKCGFFCIFKQNLNLKTQNNYFYCPLCLNYTVAPQKQRK